MSSFLSRHCLRLLLSVLCTAAFCAGSGTAGAAGKKDFEMIQQFSGKPDIIHFFNADTKITDVISDPAFRGFGRLLFPVQSGYWSGSTLGTLRLIWYSEIDPDKTVEIVNTLKTRSLAGQKVFFDIYSEAEKSADPSKRDTGLFFFRGRPGAPFAVCCAGGGFVYVGAMHDSFPHALELSKMGFNAFAIIYRPGAQTACEDLSRALTFIFSRAAELDVDTRGYSLWGGSAGARMAAWVGAYGPAAWNGADLPRPAAVIMQYTGYDEVSRSDPPTYACVGSADGIASWRVMQRRLEVMKKLGIDTEFHVYPGLHHGFGLGTGTAAEGWIRGAAKFWTEHR
jgi:acetyl esterase/lipase